MRQFHIKFQVIILFALMLFGLAAPTQLQADVGVGLSNIFALDTRENLPPDGPWQILTNKGDSFSDDLLIDNEGKIWAFYLRNTGKSQPIYLKILNPDGYVFLPEVQVATSSSLVSGKMQTLRTALNRETGEVWLTFQGDANGVGKGFFMIFNAEGQVKLKKTQLPGQNGIWFPKMASDQAGKMWFIWQTDTTLNRSSYPEYAVYLASGTLSVGPRSVNNTTGTSGTEIVVDSNNRIWFIYERGFTTLFTRIINNDVNHTDFQLEFLRWNVDNPYPFNPQRMAVADDNSHRVILLGKHSNPDQQDLLIFDMDGDEVGDVTNVGNVNFFINEANRLEVIQDGGTVYRQGEFSASTGASLSEPKWSTLFSATHAFVSNGVAYNATYEKIKAYLVQTDADVTKFYVQTIVKKPKIYVVPATLDFGTVRLEEASSKQFLVENSGTAPLTVTNITSTDNQFKVDKTQFTLDPEKRTYVNCTFRPLDATSVEAFLTITSNDPTNPTLQMTVQGSGRDIFNQKIAVTQDTLRFGTVPVTGSESLILGIRNDGEKVLNVDSLVFVNSRFSSKTDTLEIKPGVTRNVTVVFQPTVAEEVRGALEIYNDDPMSWRKDVQLIGTGREQYPMAISLSRDSLNFGGVEIEHTGTQTLTITNTGEKTLQVSNIQSNNSVFTVGTTQFSLAGGVSREVVLTFLPTAITTYTGSLTITSNDAKNPQRVVKLQGEGRKINRPEILVSAKTLSFGSVQVGRQRIQYLKVENVGDLNLQISQLLITQAQFKITNTPFTLTPGAYQWLSITYQPDKQETQLGRLEISSNDPEQPTVEIDLQGTGTATNPAQLTFSPLELVFDTTGVQNTSSKWLYLANSGTETLSISAISTTSSQFGVSASSLNLLGGQSTYLTVWYTPTAVTAVEAQLQITSNDAANPTRTISLFGVGREQRPQALSVYPEELNFGTIATNNSSTQNFLVRNTGEKNLVIAKLVSEDSQFSCPVANLTIPPNGSAYLPVTFTPSSPGSITSEMTLFSNDPKQPEFTLILSGTGRALTLQKIYLDPSQITFATTPRGSVSRQSLWVYNQGEQVLVINNISISDNQFSVSPNNFSVAPGKYQQLTVSYTPTRTGSASGVMTIQNNDVSNSKAEIIVRGDARELLAPVVGVNKNEIYFGSIAVNTLTSRNLLIENKGEKDLQISQIFTEDTQFSVNNTAFTLTAGASRLVIITFRPTRLDSVNTRLGILSNNEGSETTWIRLTGRGRQAKPQAIAVGAGSLNFGTVIQNRSQLVSLAVQNVGEAVLNITNITTSDEAFSVNDKVFTLQPGQWRVLSVQFEPTRVKEYSASLTIFSNDPATPSKAVQLTGAGRQLLAQSLVLNPTSVKLAPIGIGLRAAATVILSNPGERTLRINSIVSSNPLFQLNLSKINVEPGTSEALLIHFTPVDTGAVTGKITFSTDADGQATVELPLSGSGRNRMTQQLAISVDTLLFENVGVGRTATQFFQIQNLGENGLLVYDIVSEDHQLQIDTSAFAVEPLSARIIQVDFSPAQTGVTRSSISITSNDPEQPQLLLPVYGTSRALIPQQIALDRENLDFDTTAIGRMATQYLQISNRGDSPLNISNITSSASVFSPASNHFSIESGGGRALAITFTPGTTGVVESELKIYSDDPIQPVATVNLTGTGKTFTDQRIAISPERIDFGQIPVSDSSSQKIWVINLGEQPLLVDSVGIDDDHFVMAQTYFQINPSASQESWVTFKPTKFDTIQAQVRFKSNDPVNPYLNLPLSGSGRQLSPAKIVATPGSLDYKEIGWGFSSQKPLYIQNSGEQALVVQKISSRDTSVFKVNKSNFTVAAGQTEILSVTFKPKVTGQDSTAKIFLDTLQIQNNVALQKIQVKGTGRPLLAPTISVEPRTLDFDTVAIGRSGVLYLTIFNNGEEDLKITSIELADTKKKSQFVADKTVFSVISGGYQSIKITYTPTQLDTIKSSLVIASNDPKTPSLAIPVEAHSMNYTGPSIAVHVAAQEGQPMPSTLDFGQLLRGSKKIRAVYVINNGPELLSVTNVYLTDQTHFSPGIQKFTVKSGDSLRVDVTFTPTAAREFQTSLIFSSNDKYQPTYSVPVIGEGTSDESGTPIFATLKWAREGAPFAKTTQTAWFIRDFQLYETANTANLSLAFQQGIKVYINGALALNGSNTTFGYWNQEINPLGYLQFGRNRIAVEMTATNSSISFDAELVVNGATVILRGLNNTGNSLAEWWYSATFTQPADRKWFSNEYGYTDLNELVAHWPFNENLGTVINDFSPTGRRAFLTNISWVDGLGAKVMRFNGSTSQVKLEANINSRPLAIQLWVRPLGTPQRTQMIISNMADAGFAQGFFINQDSYLGIYIFNQTLTSTYVLEPNQWYYISVRYFTNQVLLYVNGRLVQTFSNLVMQDPRGYGYCMLGTAPLIPTNLQSTIEPFNGEISNLQIYNVNDIGNTVPAVIEALPISTQRALAGANFNLTFKLDPAIATPGAGGYLEYRPGGSRTTSRVTLTAPTDTTVLATIPAKDVTVRGLDYRLAVNTNLGKVYFPSRTDTTATSWAIIQTPGENASIKLRSEVYQMISVPYELGVKTASRVLVDDFKLYDPYNWRLFKWIPTSNRTGYYLEGDDEHWSDVEQNFARGSAFWLVSYDAKSFDADSGYSAENNLPFALTLQPGWNQISSPFPFAVNWEAIEKSTGVSALYYYNPATRGYEIDHPTMSPWEGYFVNNSLSYPITINIPATEAESGSDKALASPRLMQKYEKLAFALNIAGECGPFHDADNILAVNETSQNEWDEADAPEAPPIGNYLRIWLNNLNWSNQPGAYCVDVRATGERGYVWNVECDGQANRSDEKVMLTFTKLVESDPELKLYLFDLHDEVARDLHQTGSYQFEIEAGKAFARQFKIVLGDENFVRENSDGIPLEPLDFALMQNFPNPFNPMTLIKFSLPVKSETRLAVYNVLGQEVVVLVDEVLRAARHEVIWNATDSRGVPVASGVYFIKLKSNAQTQVRKMMLIR